MSVRCRLEYACTRRAGVVDSVKIVPVEPVFYEVRAGFDPASGPAFGLHLVEPLPTSPAESHRVSVHRSPPCEGDGCRHVTHRPRAVPHSIAIGGGPERGIGPVARPLAPHDMICRPLRRRRPAWRRVRRCDRSFQPHAMVLDRRVLHQLGEALGQHLIEELLRILRIEPAHAV